MAQMDNEANNNNNNIEGSQQPEGKDNDDNGMKSQPKKKIVLKVMLLGDEDPLRVKVKTSTAWSKIFKSFGDYKGREVRFLRFCYDGQRIQPDQTVGDIIDDVEEEDEEVQIDVMYEQQGGHTHTHQTYDHHHHHHHHG